MIRGGKGSLQMFYFLISVVECHFEGSIFGRCKRVDLSIHDKLYTVTVRIRCTSSAEHVDM